MVRCRSPWNWSPSDGARDPAAHLGHRVLGGRADNAFDVSQPASSFHLRLVREGGLVRVRPHGNQRYYRAAPEARGELRA